MHRVLIGVVVFGAVAIAGIGFAGSYAAVRELALQKGFGSFAYVFPIGIDAGICVLLALAWASWSCLPNSSERASSSLRRAVIHCRSCIPCALQGSHGVPTW
ncbi:DUF2637 domain-containing protein [Streptomyces sp. NPDC047461]|uniref:DUF2637 domain-containing protein n=1 Tax=Streptomyces sp. NPDC047461 TaxID=3155619 RepID=UPI0033FCFA9C